MKNADGKSILYGFYVFDSSTGTSPKYDGNIDMWFAVSEAFEIIANLPQYEDFPELSEDLVLGEGGGADAAKIDRLFQSGGFELQCYENLEDGCSLMFHVLGDTTVEELEAFAIANGFVTDEKYKNHVKGEEQK